MLTKNKIYICLCLFIIISVISVIYIGSLNHSPIKTPELKEDIVEHATWKQAPPKKIKISVLDSQQEFYNLGPDYKLRSEITDILNNTYIQTARLPLKYTSKKRKDKKKYTLVINKSGTNYRFVKPSGRLAKLQGRIYNVPSADAALLELENLNIYNSNYPISNNFVGEVSTNNYIFPDEKAHFHTYNPMNYKAVVESKNKNPSQYLIYDGTPAAGEQDKNIRCIINLKNGKIQQVCEVIFHPSNANGQPIINVFQKRNNIKVNVIPLDDYYVCNKFSRMEKDSSNSYQLEECEGDYAANKSIILNTPFSKYINTISIPNPTNGKNNIQYYNTIQQRWAAMHRKQSGIPSDIKNINILKINSVNSSKFFQNINSKNNFYNTKNILIPTSKLRLMSLLKILHNVYNNDARHYRGVKGRRGDKKKYNDKYTYPYLGNIMSNRYTKFDNTIFVVELNSGGVTIINKKYSKKHLPGNSTFEYSRSDYNIIFNNDALLGGEKQKYIKYKKNFKEGKDILLSAIFFKYNWSEIARVLLVDNVQLSKVQITFTINNDFNNYHYEDMKYFNNRLSDKTVKDFVTYNDYRFSQGKNAHICYPIGAPPYFNNNTTKKYMTPYYQTGTQNNTYVKINSEMHSYINTINKK